MADEFKPTVGGSIPKLEAEARIAEYDQKLRSDKGTDTKSVFFGTDAIQRILKQPNCAGISFFLSLKYSEYAKKEVVDLIMVGTTEDGTLLWRDDVPTDLGADDYATPCPPYCPK
ncbi:hypothetical protein [Chryseolinea lacunae]|uniref:Uncharacterized protein n=1 Tax=Chryseolinea lacunae TaxID=2801331 RepID=A0ABS1KT84_9BACT|nr:hypothetical protein [Chryseolinea lacunae]MBL0741907.1 hypothetical protein [Chryseolinea lacunae]